MTIEELHNRDFEKEVRFSFTRSSGPGGQNVNKVNSRVELRFSIIDSDRLSLEEKNVLLEKLINKVTISGELILVSQAERSQFGNREIVLSKFYELLAKTLTPAKKRRPTKPTRVSKEKRLNSKRINSEKKHIRRNTDL